MILEERKKTKLLSSVVLGKTKRKLSDGKIEAERLTTIK